MSSLPCIKHIENILSLTGDSAQSAGICPQSCQWGSGDHEKPLCCSTTKTQMGKRSAAESWDSWLQLLPLKCPCCRSWERCWTQMDGSTPRFYPCFIYYIMILTGLLSHPWNFQNLDRGEKCFRQGASCNRWIHSPSLAASSSSSADFSCRHQ